MSITLAVGATVVTLPPDLYWSDELSWHPVQQNVARSVEGSLIIDVAAIPAGQVTTSSKAGRPISLQPIEDNSAWITRGTYEQLLTWAATPGQQMVLTLRGSVYTVMWRHQDAPALSATPIWHYSDTDSGDFYVARLNFMVV